MNGNDMMHWDVESVVYHGADEAEDLDPEVAGIMRGYLEAGEL
jgi:hypothetical protein